MNQVNLGFIQSNPICRFDNQEPKPEKVPEEEEGVRGSSTHVDLSNLKDSGSGDLTAEVSAHCGVSHCCLSTCGVSLTVCLALCL